MRLLSASQTRPRHADNLTGIDYAPELSKLGGTLRRWYTQIINWHHTRATNGPTEAVNTHNGRVLP